MIDQGRCARRAGQIETGNFFEMRGVCMVEMMIGMATAVLVLAGCLEVLRLAQSAVGENTRRVAQQQDLRMGMEVLAQEIRLATAESLISMRQDEVSFLANIHAKQTNTTAALEPGQSVIPVIDGSGWARGKIVVLCKEHVCEMHRLSRDGLRNQLSLDGPVGSSYPAGASVEMRNRVVYYIREENGVSRLMRMVDGGAGVLIDGLKMVRFSYRDTRGRIASASPEVARVLVEIESPYYSRQREKWEMALRS